MELLPNYEEATARLSPGEYRSHLAGVTLTEITMESLTTTVNRGLAAAADRFKLQAEVSHRLEGGDTTNPELLLDWVIVALAGGKPAFRLKATYRLQFAAEQALPPEFFAIYQRASAVGQVWPFLRELAHSTTSRMGLPQLTLPLLKEALPAPSRGRPLAAGPPKGRSVRRDPAADSRS